MVVAKKPAVLGYIQNRWHEDLETVLSQVRVGQEQELEVAWERTLRWLKEERGLQGDSLRKPITQIRSLIKHLPLTADTTWIDPRSRKGEHVALHIFNLGEQEWERMNARAHLGLQERLEQQQFLDQSQIETMVHRGLLLVQSQDWAELVAGLGLGTGRRFWELVKTGEFVEVAPYIVTFRGQAKGRGREDAFFEIPTLYRAFLIVEGIERLRRLIGTELHDEYSPAYQKYNQAVNKVVEHTFADLIPVRPTRERLSIHVLRSIHARIATYWYAPSQVADITYMAQIQGHRYIVEPEQQAGETVEDVKNKQLNYAANAHYFDYKIGRKVKEGYQPVGDQGIKLGRPSVRVIDAFAQSIDQETPATGRKGRRKIKKQESTSDWAPLTVRRQTREWFREFSGESPGSGARQSEKDDTFLRRLLTQQVASELSQPGEAKASEFSLEQLYVPEKTQEVLRKAMALTGSTDLFSFLVTAAEAEAQRLVNQMERHEAHRRYEGLPTKDLDARDPEASNERFRRCVSTIMTYNEEHEPLERWYLTDLAIQKLVGGRKENIKAYKAAHAEEIEAHHHRLGIQPGFNRKPGNVQITDVIRVPDEAEAFLGEKVVLPLKRRSIAPENAIRGSLRVEEWKSVGTESELVFIEELCALYFLDAHNSSDSL